MKGQYLLREVNDDALNEFYEALNASKGSFQLDIASDGGESNVMMSFYDLIRTCGRTIHGHAIGRCQSAAVLILAACHTASCTEHCMFMVHEDSYDLSGAHNDTRKAVYQHEREEEMWAHLMEIHTGTKYEVWRSMAKETVFFGPTRAHSLGLINKVPVMEQFKPKAIK